MCYCERLSNLEKFSKLYRSFGVDSSKLDENYNHLTFKVKDLSDYITMVDLLNKAEDEFDLLRDEIVYRGMANSTWTLTPSMARLGEYDEHTEHKLIREFITKRPSEFNKDMGYFEILSKMQHFGLPTRLLDFTTNPLIALFFACCELPKNDARIICSAPDLSYSNVNLRDAVCSTSFESGLDLYSLDTYLGRTKPKIDVADYLLHMYRIQGAGVIFSKPLCSNQRIINQSAVFMVFSHIFEDKYAFRRDYFEEYYPTNRDSSNEFQIELIKEIVNSESKYFEMNEDRNREYTRLTKTYYETLTKAHGNILKDKKYTLNGEKFFKDRFLIDETLAPVSDDFIKKESVSIIIPHKAKKSILQQLKYIGITLDFVYPELEYTAKEIAEKFK